MDKPDNRITVRYPPIIYSKIMSQAKDEGRSRQQMLIRIAQVYYESKAMTRKARK